MTWNLDPTNELLLHAVDLSGHETTTQYWIAPTEVDPEGGAAAAIADKVQDLSADAVYLVEILRRASNDAPTAATDGPYPRAADKVKLVFADDSGGETIMQIPGPNETILDAGTINVDRSDAALTAFVNYVLANCLSAEGGTLVALKRGFRRRPPRRKKQ